MATAANMLPMFLILFCYGQHVASQDNCIKPSDPLGREYRGTISETKGGIPCQSWSVNEPHHKYTWPENPSEHFNYCRNSDDSDEGPWCYTTDPNTRWDYCDVSKCSECLQDTDPSGEEYIGTESHTKTGRLCQRWDAEAPHRPAHWPDNPSSHENYCRNPDGEPEAWCYTTDPNKRWEYCSVRKCSEPKAPESCYLCKGELYRGKLSQTKSGKTCQKWTDVTPHQQYYGIFYPHLRESKNYCRNPDSERPWCYTTDSNTRWEYCAIERCVNEDGSEKVPTDDELYSEVQTRCYTENGRSYRGTVSRTQSGKTCQHWTSQTPHTHEYTPAEDACSGLERNYCRNPFKSTRHRPWCYTTDPNVEWEYCEIPKCGSISVEEPPSKWNQTDNLEKMKSIYPPDPEGCYSCNGFHYGGKIDTTVSGRTCQRWDSNEPHSHKDFSHYDMTDNYCRNPDSESKPWCYTTDPDKRWEYCDIKRCLNSDGSIFVPKVKYTTECSFKRGETYRGNVSTTVSGRTCAVWGSNLNWRHTWTPQTHPCSGLERNYCRKPESYFESEAPWCYTTDPNKKWEYCNIPHCNSNGEPYNVKNRLTDECGVQVLEPVFTTQPFEIVGDDIVETDEESNRGLARIIGGETVAHGTWPWMVSLQSSGGSHFCGGTLIDKSWVLTAVHCIDDREATGYVAITGFHRRGLGSRTQGRAIKRQFLHDERIYGAPNDIALLQLDSPVEYTDYVRPICLPEPDEVLSYEKYCVAAGWGRTYDSSWTGALKQVVLKTYDCGSDYYVCSTGTEGVNENICPGDSGGPYMCLQNGKWVQYGIAAYNYGCSNKDNRSGWARISKYIGWINQIIEKYDEM